LYHSGTHNSAAESVLEEYQCGFRRGRTTVEQVFIIRKLMEQCLKFNTDLHILFVDYKMAFDNIKRTELLNAMGSYGIPKKLVRLVETTMKESHAKITIGGNLSKSFNVLQELREGNGLSAVLFNVTLDNLLKELKLNGNLFYKSKQACAYADDIALIARNTPALHEMLITFQ
jgi:hypothetical protein